MTSGYEVLLEREQTIQSSFHQARDLEMKHHYDIAIRKYREVIQSYQQQQQQSLSTTPFNTRTRNETVDRVDAIEAVDIIEEASSGYYRCLQNCGNWKDVQTLNLQSNLSLLQSSKVLYWKMEGSWRESDWLLLRRQLEEFHWLWKNQHDQKRSNDHWLFNEREIDDSRFEFSYFLCLLLLAKTEGQYDEFDVCWY